MADTTLGVITGGGAFVNTFQRANNAHDQYVREARVTAVTTNNWTVTVAGQTSQIAADTSRTSIIMWNHSTGRVYLRFDATLPTTAVSHWYIEADERYEVPNSLAQLAISMLGTVASNTLVSLLGTAA